MKVKQFEPLIGEEEYRSIKDCFDNNWITEGPKSKEFLEELCHLIGVKYAVFAPNGTLALYLGLRSIGIRPGDEVIVPNFTFIASANAVEMAGGIPVLVDVNKNMQIDIEKCENLVSNKTKAIMPVHIYGMSSNMDDVMKFANRHDLKVIEDAAQSIGVKWKEKHCGSFGDVGCFSFFADKTITTGEGGLVTTDDESVYKKLLYLRNQGRLNRGTFIHPEFGANFRITDIQAAIGLTQLKKLDYILKRKQWILHTYKDFLSDVDNVKILGPLEGSNHVPFRVCLISNFLSEGLMDHMKKNEIETRSFFYPIHKQPHYKDRTHRCEFSNSIFGYENGCCLPTSVNMSKEQIRYVCSSIEDYVKNVR